MEREITSRVQVIYVFSRGLFDRQCASYLIAFRKYMTVFL